MKKVDEKRGWKKWMKKWMKMVDEKC